MKTFDINEKIVVSIDPDSAEFAGRVFDTLSAVDKKQRGLGRAKGIASADYYDLSKSTERSMRQQIDTLFNAPVCEAVFGADPIFALSGGCPLWFNLLEGIIHTLSVPPTTECRRIARLYAEQISWWMLRTVLGANPFGFFFASTRSTRPPSSRCL